MLKKEADKPLRAVVLRVCQLIMEQMEAETRMNNIRDQTEETVFHEPDCT